MTDNDDSRSTMSIEESLASGIAKDVKEVIGVINDKTRAKKALLDQLICWSAVKNAGIETGDVKAFTFREEFLSDTCKSRNRRKMHVNGSNMGPYNQYRYHNCVRLVSGELREIGLVERPGSEVARTSCTTE